MKPQDLADKLKTKQQFGKEIGFFVSAIEKKVSEKVEKSTQKELVKNAAQLVKDVRDILESNKDGVDKVIHYLQEQNELAEQSDNELKDAIVKELQSVLNGINNIKIPKNESITQVEVKNALTEALTDVKDILIQNARDNERPSKTEFSYNKDMQMVRITERYSSYTIVTRLSYSRGLLTTITDELE
jgi:hypothetical protein